MDDKNVAKEALKKLNAKLECSICLDTYKEPKLLPCFHVFCKHCLERLVVQDRNGLSLRCPTCRQTIPLTPNGVSGLQSNFHIEHLFEIRDELEKLKEPKKTLCEKCDQGNATGFCRDCGQFICENCKSIHQMWKELKSHQIVTLAEAVQQVAVELVKPQKPAAYCSRHSSKKLKIYCEDCEELICNSCTVKLHRDHNYDLVADIFTKCKKEIVANLHPIEKYMKMANFALETLDCVATNIRDQRIAITSSIHMEIDRFHQALDQRRGELITQVEEMTEQKLKRLAVQKDHVELVKAKLSSCVEYVEGGLKTGTEGEVLAMKAPVLKRIAQLNAEFNPDTIQPGEKANLELATRSKEHLYQECSQYGEVLIDTISPENSYIEVESTSREGEQSTVMLYAVSMCGQPFKESIVPTAKLVQSNDRVELDCTVEKHRNNQYKIKFCPSTRGKHDLHVKIEGEDIRGSPLQIPVSLALKDFHPFRIVSQLSSPCGISTTSKGYTVVAETNANCVSIYKSGQQKNREVTIGSKGMAQGQLEGPCSVTVDKDDNIYVTDTRNNRIQKFSSNGQFIIARGKMGVENLEFNLPTGIAYNRVNETLYVCDQVNHRVQILDTNLVFVSSFGQKGSANGQLYCPMDIAFDSKNNVFIADCTNNRIQVFSPDGNFLYSFHAKENERLKSPLAIAIDSSDTVFVCERDKHCVSVFTDQGGFLKSIGVKGAEDGMFKQSRGLHVNEGNFVLVSDADNGRIHLI